jgi:hypothetical protein
MDKVVSEMDAGYWLLEKIGRKASESSGVGQYHQVERPLETLEHLRFVSQVSLSEEANIAHSRAAVRWFGRSAGEAPRPLPPTSTGHGTLPHESATSGCAEAASGNPARRGLGPSTPLG